MKLYGVLVLFFTLSAAFGLRCYTCVTDDLCVTSKCPFNEDRCATFEEQGVVFKSCLHSSSCISPIKCCKGDLCNGAIPTASSVVLLLVSAAITTVFL